MFGLCSLRTNSCCCGISLRTGTITILILNLIGQLSMISNNHRISSYGTAIWITDVIVIVIEMAALYGTFKRKPDFIIPHLAVTAIALVVFLLVIISCILFLPFAAKVLKEFTYQTPDGRTEHLNKSFIDSFYFIYAVAVVIMLIFEAVEFHFFKVVLSHYYELKIKLLTISPAPVGFIT